MRSVILSMIALETPAPISLMTSARSNEYRGGRTSIIDNIVASLSAFFTIRMISALSNGSPL
jgi:hypothetical protein